ncbi:Longin-like domain-containing protein [Paraphysoderma sedebokerense]|nr:Longin-like domain-containing protein [Paraphysoderma sedebokerense]
MTIFSLHIFDRHCHCIFYQSYTPLPSQPTAAEKSLPNLPTTTTTENPNTTNNESLSVPGENVGGMVGGKGTGIGWEEEAKLVYGVVFSLRNFVNKLSLKSGVDSPFHAYKTSHYKLHYYETATSLKFVLMTTPDFDSKMTREILKTLYRDHYVEFVAKNPLQMVTTGPPLVPIKKKKGMEEKVATIANELFKKEVRRYLKSLPGFE